MQRDSGVRAVAARMVEGGSSRATLQVSLMKSRESLVKGREEREERTDGRGGGGCSAGFWGVVREMERRMLRRAVTRWNGRIA